MVSLKYWLFSIGITNVLFPLVILFFFSFLIDDVTTENVKKILLCAISQWVEKESSQLGFLHPNHVGIYGHIWTCTLEALTLEHLREPEWIGLKKSVFTDTLQWQSSESSWVVFSSHPLAPRSTLLVGHPCHFSIFSIQHSFPLFPCTDAFARVLCLVLLVPFFSYSGYS